MRTLTLFIVILCVLPLHGAELRSPSTTLYISPAGNDQWSGRLPSPNPMRTDGPLATVHRARAMVRRIMKTITPASDTVTVYLRGGTYVLDSSLAFRESDSGSERMPQLWAAFQGEPVRITGGPAVTGFTALTDSTARARIAPSILPNILQLDLRAAGIRNYGTIAPRGNPGMELFVDGTRMQLARWPNDRWLHIADIPQSGDTMYNAGLEREKRFHGVPVGKHFGRITYGEDRPSRWAPAPDIFMHGYWTWDWSDSFQKVERIDTARREITIATPHHHYGYTRNQRYYFLNILEELDTPGEWYVDRTRGILFLYPSGAGDVKRAEVSLLESPLVTCENASHIRFRGITFENSRGTGISISGGNDIGVDGCMFRHLGGDAVVVAGGTRHEVRNSEVTDVARGGVLLTGGDRHTLSPGGHRVFNTAVHHYSTWLRTGSYGVILDGVGNTMEHCLIHNAPFEAVYIKGNDHTVTLSEIHSVMKESGDAGAIHTGRNWTWLGNRVTDNYFHDLQGPGLHGVMGMYMDDWASGFTVTGNVFYKAGRATLIGGGRDNIVENNLYVACSPSLHLDARGLSWAGYYFDGTITVLFDGLKEVRHDQPPYISRYPALATLPGPTQQLPMNNRIERNISWGGRWMDIYDYLAFNKSVSTIRNNLIGDPLVLRRRADGQQGWDPYYLDIDTKEGFLAIPSGDRRCEEEFPGNTFVTSPPVIFDPERRSVTIPENSPARAIGFQPLRLGEMGLVRR
ncbi:MAG: right-handed parallel beta-helix repeat-containing protein [Ignavibacteriae bacterium]|nr:right-handed parallel beta-helix repeat-containing protein [Ignavibacteriota bacterium]